MKFIQLLKRETVLFEEKANDLMLSKDVGYFCGIMTAHFDHTPETTGSLNHVEFGAPVLS